MSIWNVSAWSAQHTTITSNNNNRQNNKNNVYKMKKIEFIEIGIINIGSPVQNIHCDLFTSPSIDMDRIWEQKNNE